jgi:hypothetical protein
VTSLGVHVLSADVADGVALVQQHLHRAPGRREFSLVVKKSRFHTEGTVR